jgi:hypothetical protein
MKVHLIEIAQSVIDANLARMKTGVPFTAQDLTNLSVSLGVPAAVRTRSSLEYVANRVSDRLIQRERKAGRIVFDNKVWRAVAP